MGVFKAYDIRGIYPSELNEALAYKIGRAFAAFLGCRNVVIGMDMRKSSETIAKALIQGITDQGADVIDIGLSTTPMLYFSIGNYNYDSGIMITASHNTSEWNGFKLCREKAIPLSGETGIKEIERLVLADNFGPVSKKKGLVSSRAVLSDYIRHILKFTKFPSGLKIVADAGNGMAGLTIPKLFRYLPSELIQLYFELDGSFPNHEANPLKPETLIKLQETVLKEKADFGVAYDGDADRCCFVDEKGNVISGDLITALIAEQILKKKPNQKILYDLRSSWTVREKISENNGIPVMCRVGHAFIKNQMKEENAVFAGEISSHYYFKDNFNTESEGIPLLMIMNLLSETGKPLSEIIAPLKKYFASGEINSSVADKEAKLKQLEELYKDGIIIKIDGLSVEYPEWWFNVRASNTEPLLRLNIEAKMKEWMEQKRDELLSIIRR